MPELSEKTNYFSKCIINKKTLILAMIKYSAYFLQNDLEKMVLDPEAHVNKRWSWLML